TLIAPRDSNDPGFGLANSDSLRLYAWYTGLFCLTPIGGGWLADRLLGQPKFVDQRRGERVGAKKRAGSAQLLVDLISRSAPSVDPNRYALARFRAAISGI